MKDEELLTVLILLDDIKKYVEKQSYEGSWYNLNHNLSDKKITIDYDWGTYEEGGDYVVTIDLTEKTIRDKDSGSTVYGKFENDNIRKYENYQDIINFLKEYFAYENK